MKVFAVIGGAILTSLIIIGIYAQYCSTCCTGKPCHVSQTPSTAVPDKAYWLKRMCVQPRYRYLDQCKPFYKGTE